MISGEKVIDIGASRWQCRPLARLSVTVAAFMLAAATGTPVATPNIEAVTLDRTSFSVASLKGNVVVINFWATWCAPCQAEMPVLDAYYLAHRDSGLALMAISMDDSGKQKAVRKLAGMFHFPVALARDAKLPSTYRPTQLPATLVFDRRGVLRFDSRHTKAPALDSPALDNLIGPLLGEKAGR